MYSISPIKVYSFINMTRQIFEKSMGKLSDYVWICIFCKRAFTIDLNQIINLWVVEVLPGFIQTLHQQQDLCSLKLFSVHNSRFKLLPCYRPYQAYITNTNLKSISFSLTLSKQVNRIIIFSWKSVSISYNQSSPSTKKTEIQNK